MSSETILPLNSSTSSRSASTRCIDSDSAASSDSVETASELESASDSNSLFEEKTDNKTMQDYIDVKINCARIETEKKDRRTAVCFNPIGQCVWGVLLVIISISGFIFTPLDFMLWEKLHMRPGLPPYEWWVDPPDEVKLRVYVFNVTNHERFMDGLDDKLNVQEIGPIVYLEKLLHSNVRFNENGTMTYVAKRYPIFLPNENSIDMNATIIVPNLAVLGMASYLHDASFFIQSGFNLLVATHNSELFSMRTIEEYLWDFRDPVLHTSSGLLPGLVPVDNMGMLARIYADFTDEVTVKIGTKWGHENFFQIDRFRGNPQLPGYDPDVCPDRLTGSTEGVMYRQRLTKQDVLLYWRKTVCKLMPLYYESEFVLDSVPVYRYNLSENVFDRVNNGTDCYDTPPYDLLPGVSDASKCYYDFPMVASYPHFYTGGLNMNYTVTGLQPDRYKHNSYVIVEPLTGTPFRSVARMQSNLRMHDMSDFSSQYHRLSNLILPMFWAEYNQEGLPPRIRWTIYFMIQVLPPLTIIILATTLLLGFYFITKHINVNTLSRDNLKSFLHLKSKNVNTLAKNKILSYEKESFLKRPS